MELRFSAQRAAVTVEELVGRPECFDVEVDVETTKAPQIEDAREARAAR
jgi:hypothetical protein